MRNFQHFSPPLRLFHGSDSLRQLGRELERVGSRRAAIFCGRSLAAHPAALVLVREAVGNRLVGVFDGVRAHSPVPAILRAAEWLAEFDADAVIAVGGGSAMVTARAASILHAEAADLRQLCTRMGDDGRLISPRLAAAKLPQFVVPTTPTTACIKAGSAVFDPADGTRLALFDPKTRAQALFVHPDLLATASAALVTSASLNTLAMAVEGLESASSDPLSDADLLHALRLLHQHLPLAGGDGRAARGELVLAAVLCGRGTDTAGGGLASVLAHAIGARFGVENGVLNAVLLPHTMSFNAPASAGRLGSVGAALGGRCGDDAADQGRAAVRAFLDRLQVTRRLRDLGVPQDALTDIADTAMSDWFLQKNPRRVVGPHELLDVLRAAW